MSINVHCTGWARWSIVIYAINWNIKILTNEICLTGICPGEWDIQIPLGFWLTIGSQNHEQMNSPYNSQQQQQKRNLQNCGLCCQQNKVEKSENKNKHLDLAKGFEKKTKKKLWTMKMTFRPIVIPPLGTVSEGLIKGVKDLEITGWVETIQTTTLWRVVRILRWVLETWEMLSLKFQW